MRVIFLVIASEDSVHERDLHIQRETWASDLPNNVQVVWLRGSNGSKYIFAEDTLYVPCAELYENILQKTILGVEYIVNNFDFDVLVRTNVSTYFNLPKLEIELKKKRYSNTFFGGYVDKSKGKYFENSDVFDYISGTGIFLSKLAAVTLAKLNYKNYSKLPDDVAISKYLEQSKLDMVRMTRNNLGSTHIFIPSFYIRAKSSSDSKMAGSRMSLIHSYFSQRTILGKLTLYLQILRLELRAFRSHPEPKIRYLQKNRIVLQSFLITKGVRACKLFIPR